MLRKLFPALFVLACAAFPIMASAHSPSYVGGSSAIAIPDPMTSRAYYGNLDGTPAVYTVQLATTTAFYLNILAPDIRGARTDFEAIMRDSAGSAVIDLKQASPWSAWYEEFAGDTYLKGPEERKILPPGNYTITVTNPSDSGKYILAPGEIERFTLASMPQTLRQIYIVKTRFFDKPPYAIFEGIIGHVLLAIILIVVLSVIGAMYFIRTKKSSGG